MRWTRNLYWTHRWIGLVVSLQLLAWSVSGFTFTILDIDNVHGDLERSPAAHGSLNVERIELSPAGAFEAARAGGISGADVGRVVLRQRLGRPVYEMFDTSGKPVVVVDAETGEVRREVSEAEAVEAALADFAPEAAVVSVELLSGQAPLEFRGGTMPVYRVILDHPKRPHLYVSPVTGAVLKRRNKPWRLFDFFWMLHIMDYGEREDFNHWVLTAMSVLAILTSVSGIAIWSRRAVGLARRRA